MTTSDKQFDSQFDKVENLVHYLWIGCNYASAPNHGKTKSARIQKRNVFSTDKNEM